MSRTDIIQSNLRYAIKDLVRFKTIKDVQAENKRIPPTVADAASGYKISLGPETKKDGPADYKRWPGPKV